MSNKSNDLPITTDSDSIESIEVSGALLKAAAAIAPLNDVRYYLNAVIIDRSEYGTCLAVTDGKVLAIASLSKEPAPRATYGFPPQAIKSTAVKKSDTYKIYFTESRCFLRAGWCDINTIDGGAFEKYVDFRGVMPSSVDAGEQLSGGQFNVEYIKRAQDFVNAFYGVGGRMATTELIGYGDAGGRPMGGIVVREHWRSSKDGVEAVAIVMTQRFGDKAGVLSVPDMFSKPLETGGSPGSAS